MHRARIVPSRLYTRSERTVSPLASSSRSGPSPSSIRGGGAAPRAAAIGVVLTLALGLTACGTTVPVQDIDGTIVVPTVTVEYDGQVPPLDIQFEPAHAIDDAVVTVTPEGGGPLGRGELPVDAGTYTVTVALGGDFTGSAT